MLKHILTGGIDLPKLHDKVLTLEQNAGSDFLNSHERFNVIEERLREYDDLIASRAYAEDVETLKQRLERAEWEANSLSATVGNLSATVAGLAAKVEVLTAAKLSEVKARKAPKKDAAK